jgi:hypothetical protein
MNKLNKVLWGIISGFISVVYNFNAHAHDCTLREIDRIAIDCDSSNYGRKCPDEQLSNPTYKDEAFSTLLNTIINSGYYNVNGGDETPVYWFAGSDYIDDILNAFNTQNEWVNGRKSIAVDIEYAFATNSTYNGNINYGSYCNADSEQSCSGKITNCPSHTTSILAKYTTTAWVDNDVIEYKLGDYNLRKNPQGYDNNDNRLYVFNNISSAIAIMTVEDINDCKYFYSYSGKKATACRVSPTREYNGSDTRGRYAIPANDSCYYEN